MSSSVLSDISGGWPRSPFYRQEHEVVDDFGLNAKAAGVF